MLSPILVLFWSSPNDGVQTLVITLNLLTLSLFQYQSNVKTNMYETQYEKR